jgi:hypothetical protein
MLKPSEKVKFRARLFNANGEFIREEKAAYTLTGLKGAINESGEYTAAADEIAQGGEVKATVNGIQGSARVRVFPDKPPLAENFDSLADALPPYWVSTTLKYAVRDMNGNKVLVKLTEGSSLLSRSRAYFGADWYSNYTIEADVYATEKRRSMGDVGVIAQRYTLMLLGNAQKLELNPWQPETSRVAAVPFAWKKDTWYRMKLQVENLPDGKVRARGKVWVASEPEPEAWTIEKTDTIGNHQGSPGVFGNASQGAEVFFDNFKVTANSGDRRQ